VLDAFEHCNAQSEQRALFEGLVHAPLVMQPHPRSVLLLGAVAEMDHAVREIARHFLITDIHLASYANGLQAAMRENFRAPTIASLSEWSWPGRITRTHMTPKNYSAALQGLVKSGRKFDLVVMAEFPFGSSTAIDLQSIGALLAANASLVVETGTTRPATQSFKMHSLLVSAAPPPHVVIVLAGSAERRCRRRGTSPACSPGPSLCLSAGSRWSSRWPPTRPSSGRPRRSMRTM
jgi:hypothetical protein